MPEDPESTGRMAHVAPAVGPGFGPVSDSGQGLRVRAAAGPPGRPRPGAEFAIICLRSRFNVQCNHDHDAIIIGPDDDHRKVAAGVPPVPRLPCQCQSDGAAGSRNFDWQPPLPRPRRPGALSPTRTRPGSGAAARDSDREPCQTSDCTAYGERSVNLTAAEPITLLVNSPLCHSSHGDKT